MPPRRYNKIKRDQSMEETRRRILQATYELHHRDGITATRFEDIAKRADVSLATVYRHFPSLTQLVDGCGALTMSVIRPPRQDMVEQLFEGARSLADRIERLVREYGAFYRRAERTFLVMQRDIETLPTLQQIVAGHRATIQVYVRQALSPIDPSPHLLQVAAGLIDFGTWKSLLDAGVSPDEIPAVLARLLLSATKSERNPS